MGRRNNGYIYDRTEKLGIVQEALRKACEDTDCALAEISMEGRLADVMDNDGVLWSFAESMLEYLEQGLSEYQEYLCSSCKYCYGDIPCSSCGTNPELRSNYEAGEKERKL